MKKWHLSVSKDNKKVSKNIFGAGIVMGLFLVGGGVFSSSVFADTTVTSNASINVASSCTITTGGGTYSETIDPGTSKTITGNGINVSCNDPGGYDLYAIGYSGDSYDAPNNNRMLGTGSNFIPTANSGTSSYWAMKAAGSSTTSNIPTIDNSYSTYQIIPATYTRVSYYPSMTTGTTTNSVTTPTYKINIASNQSAGTYTGKVKYTMVHPHDAPVPVPSVTFDDAYAKAGKTKQGNYYKMQDGTSSICAAVTPGQTGTLIDTRGGGTTYSVAKIGDLCWMTTNLDLAGGTALSADDTDVTSAYISSFTTSNNLTKSGDTIVLPTSTTSSGFKEYNYSYVANSGNASSNCSTAPGCYSYYSWDAATLGSGRSISTEDTDAEQSICPKGWHLPNTRAGIDDTSDFRKLMIALGGSSSVSTYNSSTSPTGATMSSALQASPNNFLLAGVYNHGSFYNDYTYGCYWSSTSGGGYGIFAKYLYINPSQVYSGNFEENIMGYSVRCVLGS